MRRALTSLAVWSAVLAGILLAPAGLTNRLRAPLALLFRPLQQLLAGPGEAARHYALGGDGALPPAAEDRIRALEAADAERREEVAALRAELGRLAEIQAAFRPDPARILLADVRPIAADPHPLRRSLILPAGPEAGVRRGQPALWGSAVAGVVEEASARQSRVRLLTDPGLRLRARSLRSGVEGILEGDGGPRLRLALVPRDADLRPLDRLVTSEPVWGLPAGAPLARVTEVRLDPASLHLVASAEPIAPLGRLERVAILREPAP